MRASKQILTFFTWSAFQRNCLRKLRHSSDGLHHFMKENLQVKALHFGSLVQLKIHFDMQGSNLFELLVYIKLYGIKLNRNLANDFLQLNNL